MTIKPEELLVKLKSSSTPKTCKTLDVIYDICREQEQRGLNEFSVAAISRLGHKRGVPKAQSLRNKYGEAYRALLKSFEEKNARFETTNEPKDEDSWIDEIKNPKHKLLARMQASELAAAHRRLRDFVPPGTRIEVKDYQNYAFEEERTLSDLERRALEYLISEEFLGKWDFARSEYGEIVDSKGAVVLRAATVDAVKKALAFL